MTIKTLTTALTLLLTFFSTSAQDLDFVHSYGSSTEGASYDRVRISKHYDELSKVVVAGRYYEQINLDIGSNTATVSAPEDDISQGIVAIYNQEDWSLSSYISFEPAISDVILLSDTTMLVMGVYAGLTDLDPRPSDSLMYEGEVVGDGFVGLYSTDGAPHWVATFSSNFGIGMADMVTFDSQVLIGGFFFNTDLIITTSGDTQVVLNEDGTDSFLVGVDLETGSLEWSHIFGLNDGLCQIRSLTTLNDQFSPTMAVSSGNLNVAIIAAENEINYNDNIGSFLGFYSQNNQELSNFSTLKSVEDGDLAIPLKTVTHKEHGSITAHSCRGQNLEFFTSSEEELLLISEGGNVNYHSFISQDSDGVIKWLSKITQTDLAVESEALIIDKFGYLYVVGYYRGVLSYEGEAMFEENASSLNNGFILKLDPLGNLVWAHNIPSQQGELEVNSVSVNEEQDILISGYYTGNHDFDFSANTQLVGNFEEENGFLARYTQEPNEAEVFLNVPILHTEIEEAGATSLVYVSINREISEDVVVEATPDEQIDLGNGAGQPVELTFTPDGEKIMNLDVTAFDDQDVEGDHTGAITFTSSGESNFTSLEDQTITFDIIDNDPDAVEEQNSDAQISVYPNPATDEITIDYPENLSGRTIDLIRIIDANGRVVFEIKDHPKNQKLSVEDLRRSSYIMQVNTGKNEFTTKLLLL
ncbi:T9SS type A sorting domain-containing protein [Halocola ammonii]